MTVSRRAASAVQRRRHRRKLLGLAVLVCALVLVGGARWLSDDLSCPARPEQFEGESNYGRAEWGWFPIGTTCLWTEAENGFDDVERPGWAPTIVITAMLAAGLGLLVSTVGPAPSGPRRVRHYSM